jgi:hypothetical protein
MFEAMESQARQVNFAPDRRQSETALAIARGTARMLHTLGFSCISELPLPSGRRADLVAINDRGEIWIVEIKSSRICARTRNGRNTARIATGYSLPSRGICRVKSSPPIPG